jgi:hypothetical protein
METLLARDTFSFGRYAPSACRAQLEVRFRGEADIDRQAGSVENDPMRKLTAISRLGNLHPILPVGSGLRSSRISSLDTAVPARSESTAIQQ